MKQSITEIIKGILYDQELRTWVNNFISNDKGTSEDVEGMVQDAAIVRQSFFGLTWKKGNR